MTSDALVLGGGGVAGIAWETGFLSGMNDARPELVASLLAETTTLIGTSAGSTVAAQIALGIPLADLYAAQISGVTAELFVEVDFAEFGQTMQTVLAGSSSPAESRRRLGEMALAAQTPAAAARLAVIAARIPSAEWPARPLLIPAVDTATGELRVFDSGSGVSLVDAVAASCAVPGIWPTVEIDSRRYMDGGTRTVTNADLAAGAGRVLILVPSAETSPLGPAVSAEEIDALAPARVQVVYADEVALTAMGSNPLDPATRRPAAEAGRALGRSLATEIATFWR